MIELPGVGTRTQKQDAFVQALCLSHSAEGLLLSAWAICDFRVVLSLTAWNASDLYLISEVMQSWGNKLLRITCLQQKYSWARLACGADPCAVPLSHSPSENPHVNGYSHSTGCSHYILMAAEATCYVGAEGLITTWSECCGLSLLLFIVILHSILVYGFFFPLVSKRKKKCHEKFIEIAYSCI